MRDARPLVVTLDERVGGLFISFVKTGEGLWAEGRATLCRSGEGLEARFDAARLQIGPASGWLLRVTGRQAHSAGVFGQGAGFGAIYELARILDAFRSQLAGEPYLTFNVATVVGGMPFGKQLFDLRGAQLVIATPGRLLDLHTRG